MIHKQNKYYSYVNIRVGSDSGGEPIYHKIYFKHFKEKHYDNESRYSK